jgi:replicative DNA helicase
MSKDSDDSQLLPTSLEAERFVLGSAIAWEEALPFVLNTVEADEFSLEAHRRIFRTMKTLWDEGTRPDRLTIYARLKERRELDRVDSNPLAFLMDLDAGMPAQVNVAGYARVVKDLALRRRAIFAVEELKKQFFGGVETTPEILSKAQKVMDALNDQAIRKNELESAAEIVDRLGIDGIFEGEKGNPVTMPWISLAELVPAVYPQQMMVIAAPTAGGKSSFARQIAMHASMTQGLATAVYTLEMGKREAIRAMACTLAGIEQHKAMRNKLDETDVRNLHRAIDRLQDAPLYIDDSQAVTVPQISSSLRRMAAKGKVGLVIVDYVQLMEHAGKVGGRAEEVARISGGLRRLCREFECPVIALAQYNNEGAKAAKEGVPELWHLAESGALAKDANVVVFLTPRKPPDGDPYPEKQEYAVTVKKNRSGRVGKKTLIFNRKLTRFEERDLQGSFTEAEEEVV